MLTGNEVFYEEVTRLGTRMSELGDSVLNALSVAHWDTSVQAHLRERDLCYGQIESMWVSGQYTWQHRSNPEDELTDKESRHAYQILQRLLDQNERLTQAIQQSKAHIGELMKQVHQRKMFEQAYHPTPSVAGGFVATLR